MPRFLFSFIALLTVAGVASGCGSTIRGVGKDVGRVGRGVKMIFVSEEGSPPAEDKKPSFADFFKTDKNEQAPSR